MPLPGESGASWVAVALDTIAPDVAWGTPDGAVASEEMTVPYVTDEALASATLVRGERAVHMTVEADRVRVLIPADWPDGGSDVVATDDVGNATSVMVMISGAIAVPPTAALGGMPAAALTRFTWRDTQSLSTRYSTSVISATPSSIGASVSYALGASGSLMAALVVASDLRVNATISPDPTPLHVRTTASVTKLPEGPGAEDELLLLGLL